MFPRPEFSQLYKFVAWLGVACLATAAGRPVLLSQDGSVLYITSDELSKLTPLAASVLRQRQSTIATFDAWWPEISGLFVLVGVGLLVWSLLTWRARQRVVDDVEDLNRERLRRDLQSQTPQEVTERAVAEVAEGAGAEGAKTTGVAKGTIEGSAARRALQVESRAFARLADVLAPEYVGQAKVKLALRDEQLFADAVFKSLVGGLRDVVVEIKYAPLATGVRMRLRDGVFQLAHFCEEYEKATGRPAVGLLVFVLSAAAETSPMAVNLQRRFREARGVITAPIELLPLSEADLDALNGPAFKARLPRSLRVFVDLETNDG